MARRSDSASAPAHRNRELRDLYREHPLREQSILGRIANQRQTLARLTELDLAEDPVTMITDQNHIGGVTFVKELAERAQVGPATAVLDLGCGLGGSARCLAYLFGCRVHGVDLSPKRCSEARHLTKLVGLNHLVTFRCGDMLRIPLPLRRFDVLWDQGAWVHVRDKERFVNKWSKALNVGGRVALEEAYLKRQPRAVSERADLNQLSDYWKAYLVDLGIWTRMLNVRSFHVSHTEDLSSQLREDYGKMTRLAHTGAISNIPRSEARAWELATTLVEKGILGYFRLVARKVR